MYTNGIVCEYKSLGAHANKYVCMLQGVCTPCMVYLHPITTPRHRPRRASSWYARRGARPQSQGCAWGCCPREVVCTARARLGTSRLGWYRARRWRRHTYGTRHRKAARGPGELGHLTDRGDENGKQARRGDYPRACGVRWPKSHIARRHANKIGVCIGDDDEGARGCNPRRIRGTYDGGRHAAVVAARKSRRAYVVRAAARHGGIAAQGYHPRMRAPCEKGHGRNVRGWARWQGVGVFVRVSQRRRWRAAMAKRPRCRG